MADGIEVAVMTGAITGMVVVVGMAEDVDGTAAVVAASGVDLGHDDSSTDDMQRMGKSECVSRAMTEEAVRRKGNARPRLSLSGEDQPSSNPKL